MLMVGCLVIGRMVSLSQPLHVLIWQIRWGPKCRQHKGGRIGEQKVSFIQSKLKYTQKPRARANQNWVKNKRQSSNKKGFQQSAKEWKKKRGTKNRSTSRGDTRRHWRGHGWERQGSDAGDHGWTRSGIKGADTTNWQTHEGEQRLYSYTQTRRSGTGGVRREKDRWGKEQKNNGTNTKALPRGTNNSWC